MFDRMMGQFLVERGRITTQQLEQVYERQAKSRARIGVIAVAEQLMTIAQAEEINNMQTMQDAPFGELAIQKGYLLPEQVERLLERQGSEFLTFTQALIDYGVVSLEQVSKEITEFQKSHGLMESEMTALRANDIEKIVPIFVRDANEEVRKLYTVIVKSWYRLLNTHVTIGFVEKKQVVSGDCIGFQRMTGKDAFCVGITGNYEDLRKTAMDYTKEDFIETKEDTLDALCEMINCMNGIYVTKVCEDEELTDLDPPEYVTKYCSISAEEIYSLPICCDDTVVYITISDAAATKIV